MSNLNEAATTLDAGHKGEAGERSKIGEGRAVAESSVPSAKTGRSDDDQNILRFTMLFNKYNSDLNLKRKTDEEGKAITYTMFFNKEVTINCNAEPPNSTNKSSEGKKPGSSDGKESLSNQNSRFGPKFSVKKSPKSEFGKPQISEPGMMFSSSLTSSAEAEILEKKSHKNREQTPRKVTHKRNIKAETEPLGQVNVHPTGPTGLRIHNSLTSLSKNSKQAPPEGLKAKISSLTAIESTSSKEDNRLGCWDYWDDLMQSDFDKKLSLQISWSNNDNSRRSALKFKKDEAASVSDSRLLYADYEPKKNIKKCDKKSRGDSSRKERGNGGRKQVQWKTEVDVIYFSTHLAANGDRTREVIGRVMEPLREEWEQQRKGFYAKMVPGCLETHLKYRFISLLKI